MMFLGRKLPFRDDFDVVYSPFKSYVFKGNCLKALEVFRALIALQKGVYGPRACLGRKLLNLYDFEVFWCPN